MDRKIIEEHKQRLRESLKFFSNEMKPERERWVCRELLENLGIEVLDSELVSSKEDPPDVLFRSARFEVKELIDEDRPRMAEYKESLARAETATDAGELLEHYEPKTMSASNCSGQPNPDTLLRSFSYSIGVRYPSVECNRTPS